MIQLHRFVAVLNPAEAQCSGKRTFTSPQQAWGIMEKRSRSRGKRAVYRCEFCRRWHIGGGRE